MSKEAKVFLEHILIHETDIRTVYLKCATSNSQLNTKALIIMAGKFKRTR